MCKWHKADVLVIISFKWMLFVALDSCYFAFSAPDRLGVFSVQHGNVELGCFVAKENEECSVNPIKWRGNEKGEIICVRRDVMTSEGREWRVSDLTMMMLIQQDFHRPSRLKADPIWLQIYAFIMETLGSLSSGRFSVKTCAPLFALKRFAQDGKQRKKKVERERANETDFQFARTLFSHRTRLISLKFPLHLFSRFNFLNYLSEREEKNDSFGKVSSAPLDCEFKLFFCCCCPTVSCERDFASFSIFHTVSSSRKFPKKKATEQKGTLSNVNFPSHSLVWPWLAALEKLRKRCFIKLKERRESLKGQIFRLQVQK